MYHHAVLSGTSCGVPGCQCLVWEGAELIYPLTVVQSLEWDERWGPVAAQGPVCMSVGCCEWEGICSLWLQQWWDRNLILCACTWMNEGWTDVWIKFGQDAVSLTAAHVQSHRAVAAGQWCSWEAIQAGEAHPALHTGQWRIWASPHQAALGSVLSHTVPSWPSASCPALLPGLLLQLMLQMGVAIPPLWNYFCIFKIIVSCLLLSFYDMQQVSNTPLYGFGFPVS